MNDYLLVPTNVQAYLVGKTGQDLYDLAPVPRREEDVDNWFAEGKFAFSLENQLPGLESGIHLHWALPDALTHSRHDGDGEAEQPCIPNRWLVVRMWRSDNESNFASRAFVVESDYVSLDPAEGGTPFFFGTDHPAELSGKYCGRVGRELPADGWREAHEKYRFPLKSFGWGDPSFASYYPACRSVLGFHDATVCDEVNAGSHLNYLVVGWYSDPSFDPLRESSQDVLAALRWSLGNPRDAHLPQHTLCHGAVVNLQWRGSDEAYPVAASGGADEIAIGGSAAEAFAALLAPEDPSLQQALIAFQYGQASQVCDLNELGDLLNRHSFSAVPGGSLWTIGPSNDDSATADEPEDFTDSSSSLVSSHVQKLLGDLNQAQRSFDRQQREVETLRWRLFACWATWTQQQADASGVRPNRNVVDSALSDCQQAEAGLAQHKQAFDDCTEQITAVLSDEETGLQLAESSMPPFLQPKDPFVVMNADDLVGVDRTRGQSRQDETETEKRSDEEDEQNLEDQDDSLRCRLLADIVTTIQLQLSDTETKEWSAEHFFSLNLPNLTGVPCGDFVRAFALEALLFDPNSSDLISASDAALNREQVEQLQDQRESVGTGDTRMLSWGGRPPDALAVTRWGQQNPWLPTYLIWQAEWTPTEPDGLGSHDKDPAPVSIDFDPLAGDLVWTGNDEIQPVGEGSLLTGATIISPLTGDQLAANLRDYLSIDGDNDNSDALESIRQTEALGQSLGGFNDLLQLRTLGLCLPPVDPNSGQLESEIWEAIDRTPPSVIPVAGAFLPVRAGALQIRNLSVVDSFGEVRKLMDATDDQPVTPCKVIASGTLRSRDDRYHAEFSRRFVPPTRLNFDWQPAYENAPGPICGWVVPNYLDKSFAVFSARGTPLGVLESVLEGLANKTINSQMQFKWLPIPGSTLTIDEIENLRLRRFVKLVTNFDEEEGQAFLELNDLVLRRKFGRVPDEDPTMAVLLGRPLAIVHASLALEAQDPPGYWDTDNDWKFNSGGFEQLRLPVLLGAMNLPGDGLIGYMLDEQDDAFFASAGAEPLLRIDQRIRYQQTLSVAFADQSPVSLTLLMDTNAPVHASTGILPRHDISLPTEAALLAKLIQEIYIGVAPVLGARPQQSDSPPVMPQPSDAFGQWSWATRPDLRNDPPTWHEIRPADDRARFGDDLALTEGWLRLQRNSSDRSQNSD